MFNHHSNRTTIEIMIQFSNKNTAKIMLNLIIIIAITFQTNGLAYCVFYRAQAHQTCKNMKEKSANKCYNRWHDIDDS